MSPELLVRVTQMGKLAFTNAWLFSIAPIHEWAVFIKREKVLTFMRRKRAKAQKNYPGPNMDTQKLFDRFLL